MTEMRLPYLRKRAFGIRYESVRKIWGHNEIEAKGETVK